MPARKRLALWNVCVLSVVLAILGIAFRITIRASLTSSLDRDMAVRAQRAKAAWEQLTPFEQLELVGAARLRKLRLPTNDAPEGLPPRRFTASIIALRDLSSENLPPDVPLIPPRILDLQQRDFVLQTPVTPYDPRGFRKAIQNASIYSTVMIDGKPARIYSVPIRSDGATVGVLQLARSLVGVQRTLRTITTTLLMFIPAALVAVWIGGVVLTDRAIRPVRDLRVATERIEASRLSERLPVTGDDEFAGLSTTLNQMLARLESAFTQQQRFTADASHELRTPLTIIRGNASLALVKERTGEEYRETLTKIARVAESMTGVVDDLLLLARADAGELRPELVSVSVGDAVAAAIATASKPDSAPIAVQIDDPTLRAQSNAIQLSRVISNLLVNAVRHTPPSGSITVSVSPSDHSVLIQVRDTGEGIAPEHLPNLGQRFYRVDTARSEATGGTGLGLAICRSIVTAHNGTLEIHSVPGEGTTVTITLPRA